MNVATPFANNCSAYFPSFHPQSPNSTQIFCTNSNNYEENINSKYSTQTLESNQIGPKMAQENGNEFAGILVTNFNEIGHQQNINDQQQHQYNIYVDYGQTNCNSLIGENDGENIDKKGEIFGNKC